jgi:glycosyltransferase involved in cell wall biosynthesis
MAVVRDRLPDARLVIIKYRSNQAPDYLRVIEAEIDRLSLQRVVHLIPEVANSQMPMYFNGVDCVVSIPDTDGTPMTLMEAAACGTPCIVNDLPDYDPDIFVHGQSVLRVQAGDYDALGSALLHLATDSGLRQRLRSGGRAMVERYACYASEMSRLGDLYLQMLNAR